MIQVYTNFLENPKNCHEKINNCMNDLYLGENLKHLIRTSGMKQYEFAEEIGVKSGTLSNWINNVSDPPMTMILEFSNFFNVTIDDLLKINIKEESRKSDAAINHNISVKEVLIDSNIINRIENLEHIIVSINRCLKKNQIKC